MKTDKLFYRIFLEYPAIAFELAGLPVPPDGAYLQESVEIKETSFRLDGVLRPTDPQAPILFWEAQLQLDETFYARWFASILLHHYQHPWPCWRGLVIYPDRKTERLPTASLAFILEHGPIHRVYLEDLLQLPNLTWAQGLLRLIIADNASVPGAARLLSERIDQRPSPMTEAQALDLLETLLIYKLPKLTIEGVRAMLHIPDTRLQDTVFYKEVFGKGHEAGQYQEATSLVLRQLKRRLGPAAGRHEAAIRGLGIEAVEQLGEDLLEFASTEELERWLEARKGASRQ